jgi:hypothetical protein
MDLGEYFAYSIAVILLVLLLLFECFCSHKLRCGDYSGLWFSMFYFNHQRFIKVHISVDDLELEMVPGNEVSTSPSASKCDKPPSYPELPSPMLKTFSKDYEVNISATPPPRYSSWFKESIFKKATK